MTELKEATLTKKQAAELNDCIEMLKKEDYAWELKNCDYSDFERSVFARAAGWLWSSKVPFTSAYNVVRAFAYEAWNLWREKINL